MSDFVKNTCKIGKGRECCRYLVGDATGLHCGKLSLGVHDQIDARVEAGAMMAQGDNCDGRPLDEVL